MLTRQSRVIIACIAVWSVGATDPDQATRRWWNHVRVLASDGMQGRDTGSLGHRKAAEYVAESFKRSGLRPAGDAGYLQPVPLQAARFQADRSSLSLIAPNGRVTPMRWLRDVMTAPRLGLPESFEAELVFEGYDVRPTSTSRAGFSSCSHHRASCRDRADTSGRRLRDREPRS